MSRTAFAAIACTLCLTLGVPPVLAARPGSRPPGPARSRKVATRTATCRAAGASSSATARLGAPSAATVDYVLGPEDVITVTVLHQPDFGTANQEIDPDGRISLPLLGSVRAAGTSTDQLAAFIRSRLARYLELPTVLVTLDQPRPLYVNVIGAVGSPGLIKVPRDLPSLMEALALAGGVSRKGDSRHIHLIDPAGTKIGDIDLADYLSGHSSAPLPRMHNGDTVVVDTIGGIDWLAILQTGLSLATLGVALYVAMR